MEENKQNLEQSPTPDFSQITERPPKAYFKRTIVLLIKIFIAVVIALVILSAILGFVYYKNFTQAAALSFSGKDNLELAVHKIINRDFKAGAELISQANSDFTQAKELMDKVIIIRYIPYVGTQVKAVDQTLISGIKLTGSGKDVVLLIDEIVSPLANESITYAQISTAQKKDMLQKIVDSQDLLLQVQSDIDDAVLAIDQIPADRLVKPLKDGILPLKEYLPKVKKLIDNTLPMIEVLPELVGFNEPKAYLFLLQNNHELRPTGGFIGTYGILKLENGELVSFDTDNIYNLDRAPQYILQIPSPEPIAKYLDQPYASLRDINWSPDFPTTAQKAIDLYHKEHEIWFSLEKSGKTIVGEEDITVTDLIDYQENLDGVIAMTPEILGGLLKITGPIVAGNKVFTADNYHDQIEISVGLDFRELNIPISERKGVIKDLSDQIKVKLFSMSVKQIPDVLDVFFNALSEKQILIYLNDPDFEQLVVDRNWAGNIRQTGGDYLMVVDTNLASLKTDQFVKRFIDYKVEKRGDDFIATTSIRYKNEGTFDWRTTRLRTYTRIYVPQGSELISSSGTMENDKTKDPESSVGKVDVMEEFNKTVFGAFIVIEPQEEGVLTFEYKLPERLSKIVEQGHYDLLVQKQPGVIHDLTLGLKFDKNIQSAEPNDLEPSLFDRAYNYSAPLNQDKQFFIEFK